MAQVPLPTAWLVEVDAARCTFCEVCSRRCVPGAMKPTQRGNKALLLFEHKRCDGCAYCVENCPEGAARLVKLPLSDVPGESFELVSATFSRCPRCNTLFFPMRLRARVVERQLAAGIAGIAVARRDEAIYRYCPTCRWRTLESEEDGNE